MTETPLPSEVPMPMPSDPHDWVQKHGDALYRFALRKVGRTDVAEDLVQETLLAAWKSRHRYEGRSSVRSWLTSILKRKVVDWMRRTIRERAHTSETTESDPTLDSLFTSGGKWKVRPGDWPRDDPSDELMREDFWGVLHGCLKKLPGQMRNVFVLRHLDERPSEEICQSAGITPTNYWVVLHRGRMRLWKCLRKNWFEDDSQTEAKS